MYFSNEHKQFILGTTSLWLLLPFLLGLYQAARHWPTALLSVVVLVTVMTSTAMWYHYRPGSLLHKADIVCASVLFVCLVVFHSVAHVSGAARQLPLSVQASFPMTVIVFYAAATGLHGRPRLMLREAWCHLLFRYFGFWWSYLALVSSSMDLVDLRCTFLITSGLYFGHIGVAMWWSTKSRMFDSRAVYARGCMSVLLPVAFLAGASWRQTTSG